MMTTKKAASLQRLSGGVVISHNMDTSTGADSGGGWGVGGGGGCMGAHEELGGELAEW